MAKKQKYDFDRLDKYCKENNVTLLEDYSNIFTTKNSCIKGNCIFENCKNPFEKTFCNLEKTGAYCKVCIKIVLTIRMKETFLKKYGSENILHLDFVKNKKKLNNFNNDKLLNYCNENKLELLEDYSTCNLTKQNYIKGKCIYENCNNTFEKKFRELERTGAYCKVCINKIKFEKTKKTCLEKYGVENSSQSKEVQNKYKQTCLEKYGVEHAFQSEIIKTKIKKTFIERYGVENAINNKEIREKSKNTCLEKYGVDNSLKNKIVREKCKNTILEKYGVENPSQNETIKNKKIETSLKNWGVKYPSQNNEIKNKKKETNILNLGVEYPTQNKEVQQKIKQTNLQNLGVEYTFQSEIVKDKIKQTNLQNLGVEYPTQNKEVQQKIKETNLQNLGVEYPSQNKDIKNKTVETCLQKYGCKYSLQNEEIKKKGKETCLKKYGCEHPFQNGEIMEKNINSSFTKKEYIFPSGNIIKIQGYEHFALNELIINENIEETDIITGVKNVPTIWYHDENGKQRRHYVDIFIPSQNRCIEVKSEWTYQLQINTILLKQEAAKELGYTYEIWIFDKKGNKIH
jgi:hypothetical protein